MPGAEWIGTFMKSQGRALPLCGGCSPRSETGTMTGISIRWLFLELCSHVCREESVGLEPTNTLSADILVLKKPDLIP